MSGEGVAAIVLAVVAMVTLLGGGAIKLLTMHIDNRVRKQLNPVAKDTKNILRVQEANGIAIGNLAGKIDNGLSRRLGRVESALDRLTAFLLDDR